MRGVYLVAAELSRLGFIASPTSRSARGADILATDQGCERAFSVQVKTNAGNAGFWLVGKHVPVAPSHFYVLVNLKSPGAGGPAFWIVPSHTARERTHYVKARTGSKWWAVYRREVTEFRDKWELLGDPRAEAAVDDPTCDEPDAADSK
jgi:hypothetical protein